MTAPVRVPIYGIQGDKAFSPFKGNGQAIDHVLVPNHMRHAVEYDIVHVNSEFSDQDSDHDPVVARVSFA